mmetsp:Transcript_33970/g.86117  ORF Transcript_33970/g.86117 Transcript_33970/m.86117 type:complete len:221 (-) Transcript_33970:498-1160(-)
MAAFVATTEGVTRRVEGMSAMSISGATRTRAWKQARVASGSRMMAMASALRSGATTESVTRTVKGTSVMSISAVTRTSAWKQARTASGLRTMAKASALRSGATTEANLRRSDAQSSAVRSAQEQMGCASGKRTQTAQMALVSRPLLTLMPLRWRRQRANSSLNPSARSRVCVVGQEALAGSRISKTFAKASSARMRTGACSRSGCVRGPRCRTARRLRAL